MQLFAACLVLTQCLASAVAIQCYHCSYNSFDSDNSVLSLFLTTMSKLSNEKCKMLVDNDKYELPIRNCPVARPGHVYKCGLINGQVTAKFGSVVTVDYRTIDRNCIEVREDDSETEDRCYEDAPMSESVRKLVYETFEGNDLGNVEFSGKVCYDSYGVQINRDEGPMCPRCTKTELEVDNDVVQWFIDGIRSISDDSCYLDSADDIYEVEYRLCPPAAYGQVAKCGDINGRITGRVLSTDFTITTLQRDCVNGEAQQDVFKNGCHNQVGSNAIIAPLIEESYNSASGVSNQNFEGQACFQPYFAPLTAGSETSVLNYGVVLATLISSLLAALYLS